MTKISVKDMLDRHAASAPKIWAHDRAMSVGASEIGQCLRKTWFAKNGVAPDASYLDRYGAKLRGDLIERHHWEPGIRAQLVNGAKLLFAGDEQKTLVDGYLSATSDGLLTGVSRDCLAHHGVDDIGADCLVVECKSIDPRIDIRDAKAEHRFQVHCQIGLIRHCTEYQPEYALISYTDASFLDDITEFAIRFDPEIYAAAKTRAIRVMTADAALDLPAEGKLAGGGECKYCPHQGQCIGATVGAIPGEIQPLGDSAMAALKALVDDELAARDAKDATTARHAEVTEQIKEFLREHKTRKVEGDDWLVSYFPVKGHVFQDLEAAKAAGIDLTPFEKRGDPSERLTITVK